MEDMEADRSLAGCVDEQREIHPLWRVPSKQKEGFPHHVISSNLSSKSSQPCQQHERGGRLGDVQPFPRPADCAHFHYEYVTLTSLQLSLVEDEGGGGPRGHLGGFRSQEEETKGLHHGVSTASQEQRRDQVVFVVVLCKGRSWVVERNIEDFHELDSRLHSCIYKRHYSKLPKLRTSVQPLFAVLSAYLSRLSQLADDSLICASVLTWFELDNYGGRLADEASCVNIPAILAARVVQSYQAAAPDELSLQVGDFVSIIDRPAEGEPGWWRGKLKFEVGFFPGDCVEPIEEGSPCSVPGPLAVRPVHRSKVALLLRGFFGVRPPRSTLRRRGILKERLFGCDLGEHLMNSGEKVPRVVVCCCEFLEKVGLVDGIYRHSGSISNLQRLRHEFDSEMVPNLASEPYSLDIHCVSSLCKLYFRELPNPLLTYPLYHYFTEAVAAATEEDQLRQTKVAIEQLPPPHYRTFCYLLSHLCFMASQSNLTSMDARNLAIVWAPNLLRSREVESGVIGSRAFFEVRAQATVLEFIITHGHRLIDLNSSHQTAQPRPKSLGGASSAKLLSLAEAQALSRQVVVSEEPGGDAEEMRENDRDGVNQSERLHPRALRRIAVGGGGGSTGSTGEVKGPAMARSGWRSFFQLTKGTGAVRRRLQRHNTSPEGGLGWRSRSEESLSALASKCVPPLRPPRPRSSEDLQPVVPEARSSPHSPFRAAKFKPPDIANFLGSRSRERRSDGTVLEDMFVFVAPSQPPIPPLSRPPPSEAPPPYSPPRPLSLSAISPPATLQSSSEELQHLSFQVSSPCPPCLPPQNSGIQSQQFNSEKHSALPPRSRSSRGTSTSSKEAIFAVTSTYNLVTNQEVAPVMLAPVVLPQRNLVNVQHHPRPSVLRPKTAFFHNGKVHYRSSLEPVHTSHPIPSPRSSSYHVRTRSDPDWVAINPSTNLNDVVGGVVRCNNRSTTRPVESPPDVLPDLTLHFHNSARQLHSGHIQEKAGSPSRLPEQRVYRPQEGPSRFHVPSPTLLKTCCSTSRTTMTTFSAPTVHTSRQDVHGVQGVVGVGGRFFWRDGTGDPALTHHQTYDVERPVEMRQVPLRHVAPPPNSHPRREFSSTDLDWQEKEGVGGLEPKLVVPPKYSSNLLRSDL
uniref:rho GTPase-activating protein 33-like isoform X2 n=1 Tax=Myxine glutinosa TaxID=7769 RepID=UPI00358FBC48